MVRMLPLAVLSGVRRAPGFREGVASHHARPAGRRRTTWRGLVGLCLALLFPVEGCGTQAPSATSPGPAPGADQRPYRRGVWLLLDSGENRHACQSGGLGRYRYIVVQWYMTRDAACPLQRIKAANPSAKVLAYQNIGAMIAGPHTDGRPSTCITQEEAAAHDAATPGDAWRGSRPTATTASSATTSTSIRAMGWERAAVRRSPSTPPTPPTAMPWSRRCAASALARRGSACR